MYLLKKLLAYPSHYQAQLPYNLNWRLKSAGRFRAFLQSHPIIVADVGARGGCLEELAGLKQWIDYFAFDADADADVRPGGYRSAKVFPWLVGSGENEVPFHLYRRPAESSALAPASRYKRLFEGPEFDMDRTVTTSPRTLDEAFRSEFPDFLKLDIQGTELSVLEASPQVVRNATMVEVEAAFIQMYEGQPLFHDVCAFMYENDFEMLYLNRVFRTRRAFQGSARGQVVFGDALFGRREDRLQHLAPAAIAKYAILLTNYGYPDIAADVLRLHPVAAGLVPPIGVERPSRIVQGLIAQLDKALCLALSLRKSNRLPFESDRSWPIN